MARPSTSTRRSAPPPVRLGACLSNPPCPSQATTPMDPRVLDAMLPFLSGQFGNPHSKTHEYGWEAESASEAAREQVASLVGADSKEIVFTSGATESNNMAIKGIAHFYGEKCASRSTPPQAACSPSPGSALSRLASCLRGETAALAPPQEAAHHHDADGAQVRPRLVPRAAAGGLRGRLPPRQARRAG